MRTPLLLAAVLLLAACSDDGAPGPTAAPTAASRTSAAAPTAAPTSTSDSPGPSAAAQGDQPSGPAGGPVPARFSPRSFSFVSSKTGWVLGDAPCSAPPCTSLVRTRDGGRTWQGVPAPEAPLDASGPEGVRAVRFAGLRDGFAWGGALFATHDGGASWHRVRVPGRVQALEASGGRVVTVVQACDGEDCDGPAQVLSGPASGDALQRVADLPTAERAVLALHGQAAYVVRPGERSTDQAALLASEDGVHYAERALPCRVPDLGPTALAASDDTDLVLVCGGEGAAGHEERHVWTTADAGRHWRQAGDPPQLTGSDLAATGAGTFLTDGGGLSVTRDGRTWSPSLKGYVSAVGFVDDDLGFALQDGLRVTRDAGRTWSPVRFGG